MGQGFVDWYNTEHRHSALRYVTPEQRHNGQATAILAQRQELIEQARQANPERWKQNTQQLALPEQVHLNPDRSKAAKLLKNKITNQASSMLTGTGLKISLDGPADGKITGEYEFWQHEPVFRSAHRTRTHDGHTN